MNANMHVLKKMIRFSNLNRNIHSLAKSVEEKTGHRLEILLCDPKGGLIASSGENSVVEGDFLRKVSAISSSIMTEYTAVEDLCEDTLNSIRVYTDRNSIFAYFMGTPSDSRRLILLVVFPLKEQVGCNYELTAIANSIHHRMLTDITPLLRFD